MLRVGLFGLGRWGTNILNTLKTMEGVEVAFAYDPMKNPSFPPLVRGERTPFPPAKGDLPAGQAGVQGVIVATPGSTHAEVALPFIKAGIPTYIEKPLTLSMADARKLERAAKKSGALIFCGHLHLYNPAYQVAKQHAQHAGKLRYISFEGMNNGPFRDDMSAMWDWASHDVYLAMDLLGGQLPKSVQAWGIAALRPKTNLYDFSLIKMMFAGGVEAISMTSWLSPEKRKNVTIVGESDSIVFDDTLSSNKVTLYKGLVPGLTSPDKGRRGGVLRQEPTVSYPSYSEKSPLQAELEAFIDAIKTGQQPRTGLPEGVAVVRVLAAAEKSIALDGKRILV